MSKRFFRREILLQILLWPCLLWLGFYGSLGVSALSQNQHLALIEGATYFNTEDSGACGSTVSAAVGGSTASPSQNQIANAKIVMGIAKTENLGEQGALIGLMVGLAESSLTNLANSGIPVSESNPGKQGDGNNWDSLGIFQQRVATGWSTLAPAADQTIEGDPLASQQYTNQHPDAVNQVMTPAYAAEAFFGSPPGANAPSAVSKGLQNKSGWQNIDPWLAAQAVQASADSTGSVYKKEMAQAQSLLNQYWDSAAAVSLPVPLSGGNSGTSATGTTGCAAGGNASITQAVINAGLAEIAKNIPYVYGGGGPNGPSGSPTAGFDCSSFMQYVFYQGAHITLPRTAGEQYNATVGQGHSVQLSAIQPGDLLFYGSSPSNIAHVVMYIGNNQVMQAPQTGMDLDVVPLYKQAAPGETLQGIGFYPPVGG